MLSCDHFGVFTFTFHLKNLFKKFSQQRAGYHLVAKGSLKCSWALVWVSPERGIGPKTQHARNQAHTWESSPSRPKIAFGCTGFAFWPTSIPWGQHGSFAPHHRTPRSSSTRAPRARLSSLFRAMVGRLSRAAAGEPYHARKVRQLLILLPPSISSTTSSTPHSFFPARVCQAATIAVAAAADPRFGSSRWLSPSSLPPSSSPSLLARFNLPVENF
jgi:hypothetical protein